MHPPDFKIGDIVRIKQRGVSNYADLIISEIDDGSDGPFKYESPIYTGTVIYNNKCLYAPGEQYNFVVDILYTAIYDIKVLSDV